MRHILLIPIIAILSVAFVPACSHSPVSPTAPSSPTSLPSTVPSTATGRAIDALTGAAIPSITVRLDDGMSSTTSADGAFQLTAAETGMCSVTASGPNVVDRETELRMPGTDASLSLIPSQFDLGAFDEMCRSDTTLHRWTAAPALVIIDAVLQFTNTSATSFTALGERLTADEIASITGDLGWGLPQVTGGTFGAFASVTVESPATGASVNFFSREGRIVVARFRGLSRATGDWGYGRWAGRGAAVVAGAMMIDRDFDTSPSAYVRSLRVHEMGHALGYSHVTRRQSFMNSAAMFEPNAFDRDATRVAFQRPPGNQSPDRDPSASRTAQLSGMLTWSEITR
jgi:hypothetical protein